MNVRYKSKRLKKILSSAAAIKMNFGTNAKRVAQRMDDITSSPNLEVLCSIPSANCHRLTGDRKDEWAVDISANHRLVFKLDHDPIPLKKEGSINRIEVTNILIISAQEDYH